MNTMSVSEKIEQATYSIGVVERMTGISAHKLRIWERRYQLGPSKRSKGGQREFTLTDIDHLKLLKQLTDSGMRIGDIARLPRKTLSSLLMETNQEPQEEPQKIYHARVFGSQIGQFFSSHKKRYPNIAFEMSEMSTEELLAHRHRFEDAEIILLQIDTITATLIEPLKSINTGNQQIIIFYQYTNKAVREALENEGVVLASGELDVQQVDSLIHKAINLREHLASISSLQRNFNLPKHKLNPHFFNTQQLLSAEGMGHKLNCECPPHLVELIRKLNAFEEYSKHCAVDSWREAAVHTCIHAYTNQARFLLEKALQAVLEE